MSNEGPFPIDTTGWLAEDIRELYDITGYTGYWPAAYGASDPTTAFRNEDVFTSPEVYGNWLDTDVIPSIPRRYVTFYPRIGESFDNVKREEDNTITIPKPKLTKSERRKAANAELVAQSEHYKELVKWAHRPFYRVAYAQLKAWFNRRG